MSTSANRRQDSSAYTNPGDPPSKQRILQAALRLFAERGLHAVTVRDVAEEAGYTNPALFKYFDSKQSLAIFLFEHCYLNLYEKLRAQVKTGSRFDDQLLAVVVAFLAELDRDGSSVLFVQEHLRELWPHASRKTRAHSIVGLIREILQHGVEEGAVGTDENLSLLGVAVIGTLAQFARLFYFGEFKSPAAQYAAEIATMLIRIATS